MSLSIFLNPVYWTFADIVLLLFDILFLDGPSWDPSLFRLVESLVQVECWKTHRDQEVLQRINEQSHEIKYLVEDRAIIEQTWILIGKDPLHEDMLEKKGNISTLLKLCFSLIDSSCYLDLQTLPEYFAYSE